MEEKLTDVERRFEELNALLSDPKVASNMKLLRDYGKERNRLDKIVATFRDLKKLKSDLAGNRDLLATEKDPDLIAMAKEELSSLEQREVALSEQLKIMLLPPDPNDGKNIILEIRAGTGGDEAALFAGDLFRMYLRFAESHRWKVEALSTSAGAKGGYKEVIVLIEGDDAYSQLKYESGVHRVQRVPETEAQGRIHTSAVSVAVLPEAEDIDIKIEDKDLRIDVFRSGGPGGQSVNTTDSAVRITHLPSNMVVICQDEKSQIKNKSKAMKILRARLMEKAQEEQDAEISAARRAMVKGGDRSDKIRTYNFPQDRLTDHRIGFTTHNLPRLLDGQLQELVVALRTHVQAEALKGSSVMGGS
ncbi:MAG: peptide chain release factor 1 [Deltaproteobacteria bacterium]|nr:peptide chain release factor 1 [Deltaproteobacteria bacterium]